MTLYTMFAGIESLLGVLIFILISVLASWLQKKQRQEHEEGGPSGPTRKPAGRTGPTPATTPGRPEPEQLSWEEELKRLLGGTLETPAPPPPPPPVLTRPRQPERPAPPPLVHETTPGPVLPEHNPVEVSFKALPTLTESVHAYQEASGLDDKVKLHLSEVTRKRVGLTSVHHRPSSREATEAMALVRNPTSVRSAVLASIILGPPRSLAE